MAGDSTFTSGQVESIIMQLGIRIVSEGRSDYACMCPYHKNESSPAMYIRKDTGIFHCFSPSCMQKGNLLKLVMDSTGLKHIQATRFIAKHRGEPPPLIDRVRGTLEDAVTPEYDINLINKFHGQLLEYQPALDYLHDRNITDESINTFKIGYRVYKTQKTGTEFDMTVVPMFDAHGKPVGVIGRSIKGKIFKNSKGLPTSEEWWNLNRAKRCVDWVVVVESVFDAIRVHQAGYPNVVAILGGHIPDVKAELLSRFFNRIVIATDFDKKEFWDNCIRCGDVCKGHNAGRDIGELIVDKFSGLRISWAAFDEKIVYPHGAKDMSDLTDDEIQQVIEGAVSNFTYQRWNLY